LTFIGKMSLKENKRLFLAIPLDTEQLRLCHDFIALQGKLPVRWIDESNWHLTLVFIGNFPAAQINTLISELGSVSSGYSCFNLKFDKFLYIPNTKHPTMIWQQFEHSENFDRLIHLLYSFLESFYKEHSIPFSISIRDRNTPHMTLSRLKQKRINYPYLKMPKTDGEEGKLQVNSFRLYESLLKSQGAEYHLLGEFSLRG
jgi:RNA 2',3'-cyclic 3'-phosphodiesterase